MTAHVDDSLGLGTGSIRRVAVSSATLVLITMTSSLTGSLLLPAGGPITG